MRNRVPDGVRLPAPGLADRGWNGGLRASQRFESGNVRTVSTDGSVVPEHFLPISLAQTEGGTSTAQNPQKLASLLVTGWYGAIVRRKSDPSVKLLDDFLPFFIPSGIL
jgi:hypothetical protein